jgi:hypothetical protein
MYNISTHNSTEPFDSSRPYKVHLVVFASSNFTNTLKRIKKEAEDSGFFDYIHAFTEKDFPEYINKHSAFIQSNKRGYGYWIWKPYCVKYVLDKLNEGDVLVYLDAGSTINPKGVKRFNEYIDMCKKSEHKNVSFQYTNFIENEWTKNDIF